MKRRTVDPWFYDAVCDHYFNSVQDLEQSRPELQREIHQRKAAALTQLLMHPGMYQEASATLDFLLAQLDTITVQETRFLSHLQKAHPIAVGAATLDSLLHAVPSDFHYVQEGKLPFDILFFDFSEKYSITLPFSETKADLNGIFMMSEQKEGERVYVLTALFSDKNRVTYSLDINTTFGSDPTIYCMLEEKRDFMDVMKRTEINPEPPSSSMNHFLILPDQKVVYAAKSLEAAMKVQHRRYQQQSVSSEDFDEMFSYDSNSEAQGGAGTVASIANLAVNLINYINAHNVSVIRKEREVILIETDDRNKRHRRELKRPFYIVNIKDTEYVETEEPIFSEGRKLDHRLYTRGHDRHYKDSEGRERLVVWINPCIKGPADAPFFNQRHAVNAAKWLAEKQMLAQYQK